MCTKNQLELILKSVAAEARKLLGNRMISVILYGSYARGDYDEESDIDILIVADVPREECWPYNVRLIEQTAELELNNDVLLSTHIVERDVFERYGDVLPFYRKVLKEGIRIAG